jgi:hypothetical protein
MRFSIHVNHDMYSFCDFLYMSSKNTRFEVFKLILWVESASSRRIYCLSSYIIHSEYTATQADEAGRRSGAAAGCRGGWLGFGCRLAHWLLESVFECSELAPEYSELLLIFGLSSTGNAGGGYSSRRQVLPLNQPAVNP